MFKRSLLELLRSDGSIIVNKNIANVLGLEVSTLYSELLSKFNYYEKENKLDEEKMFFCTVIDLEYSTSLSKRKQLKGLKILESIGLIETKLKGLPAKRHFKILMDDKTLNKLSYIIELGKEISEKRKKRLEISNEKDKERLIKYLNEKEQNEIYSCLDSKHLDIAKRSVNNTNYNNTNNNINNNVQNNKNEYKEIAEEIYKEYPRKEGKVKGIEKVINLLKNKKITKEELLKSVRNYSKEKEKTDKKYILIFSTFMNGRYEDYLYDSNIVEDKGVTNMPADEIIFESVKRG